jgi:hypothetical protein
MPHYPFYYSLIRPDSIPSFFRVRAASIRNVRTCRDNSIAYLCYAVEPSKNNGVIASKPEHLLPLLFHKKNKLVSF